MKILTAIVCLVLAGIFNTRAEEDRPWWTSAETRRSLVCAITSSSNSVAFGSQIPVVLTLRNTGTADVELPHPFGGEMNMEIRFYLLNAQTGDRVGSSPLRSNWDPRGEKGSKGPENWIKLPPNEQKEIPLLVEIPSKGLTSESAASLSPGNYGLECEIEYHMGDILSGKGMLLVTPNTTTQTVEKYKEGRVLVYMGQLWTGKTESNILPFILTAGPK